MAHCPVRAGARGPSAAEAPDTELRSRLEHRRARGGWQVAGDDAALAADAAHGGLARGHHGHAVCPTLRPDLEVDARCDQRRRRGPRTGCCAEGCRARAHSPVLSGAVRDWSSRPSWLSPSVAAAAATVACSWLPTWMTTAPGCTFSTIECCTPPLGAPGRCGWYAAATAWCAAADDELCEPPPPPPR